MKVADVEHLTQDNADTIAMVIALYLNELVGRRVVIESQLDDTAEGGKRLTFVATSQPTEAEQGQYEQAEENRAEGIREAQRIR